MFVALGSTSNLDPKTVYDKVPMFKVDSPGLWQALMDGRKKWEARWIDPQDPRFSDPWPDSVLVVRTFQTDPNMPYALEFICEGSDNSFAEGWRFYHLGKEIARDEKPAPAGEAREAKQ